MMKTEDKARWIKALRSGKYAQKIADFIEGSKEI